MVCVMACAAAAMTGCDLGHTENTNLQHQLVADTPTYTTQIKKQT